MLNLRTLKKKRMCTNNAGQDKVHFFSFPADVCIDLQAQIVVYARYMRL